MQQCQDLCMFINPHVACILSPKWPPGKNPFETNFVESLWNLCRIFIESLQTLCRIFVETLLNLCKIVVESVKESLKMCSCYLSTLSSVGCQLGSGILIGNSGDVGSLKEHSCKFLVSLFLL